MSHLDRQTSDWSWTKEGREKTKKESGARESSEVVLLLFYKATTTSNNMGKKILAARREVEHTTYSTTASFWKNMNRLLFSLRVLEDHNCTFPNNNNNDYIEVLEDSMNISVYKFVKGGRDQKFIKVYSLKIV